MKYMIWISGLVIFSACSMMSNQKEKHPNSIRVIKEEQVKYQSYREYNSKIEQVDYNSSIIAPEIDPNYTKVRVVKPRRKTKNHNNTTKIPTKVSSHVHKQKKKVTKKVEHRVTRRIEKSIDSLFE